MVKHHDEEDASIFPASWEVTRLLVANFSEYTRADLANVLGKATPQVNTLLEALQSTLDFEAAISKRFGIPVSLIDVRSVCLMTSQFEEVTVGGPQTPAAAKKWTISSIFDNHFSVYVDAQDRSVIDSRSSLTI